MLEQHWNDTWNHLEEFWLLLDNSNVVRQANPYTREWFLMHSGRDVIGFCYDINPTSAHLENKDGWEIYLSKSRFTGRTIEYRLKPVEGGWIVTVFDEDGRLDQKLLQRRLEEAQANSSSQVMLAKRA